MVIWITKAPELLVLDLAYITLLPFFLASVATVLPPLACLKTFPLSFSSEGCQTTDMLLLTSPAFKCCSSWQLLL